ncbi:hypothetical protein KAJ27_18730 [bacterium]|nr:hypothetical protein [bacterium]
MKKSYRLILAIAVLSIFLSVQVSSVRAEDSSPVDVVENFAKAYFMIDDVMADYLSKEVLANYGAGSMLDHYLEKKAIEASACGYKITYLQKLPTNMKIKVLNINEFVATIQFEAITIRSINPVYRIIGSALNLVEEYKVKEIISMVKERGTWKIAPGAFEMPI